MKSLFNICHHLSSSCLAASFESYYLLKPTLIENKTCIKNILILEKSSNVPACFGDLFENQIATLCHVVEPDK